MNFVDDVTVQKQLYPFTLTRTVAGLRVGILTIREKWLLAAGTENIVSVPSHLLPSAQVITALQKGAALPEEAVFIQYPWHIFQYNDQAIRQDYECITAGRISETVSSSNKVSKPENIFIEEGAIVEHCTLNAAGGPIYIGKNAEVMEGSLIRGPVAVCEGSVVKMGAKIYGATTIGPYSVAGGEVKNSVIFGYSNKAHDGYLGDAVVGEWCNMGAGTSNSNLKNNGSDVKIFNPLTGGHVSAGIKCGLLMGDYSRAAINTSFNTGTITGVCCNIFCQGLTPTSIPSFSWGYTGARYSFDKAIRDIAVWKKFKRHVLTEQEIQTLQSIYNNY